jgi:membrane protease YdiL (CAAX protease family)
MRVFTQKEKHFIGTTTLIVFCILFFAFFEESPTLSSVLQGAIITSIFFLVLPIAYTRLVLREPLAKLGLRGADNHTLAVLWSVLLAMGGFLACWALVYTYPNLAGQAIFPVLVETSFVWFTLYTLTLLPLTLFIYEVFFRGMVQILWLENTWKAVGAQAILFIALLQLTNGITLVDVPLLLAALLAGIVAKKTGSLWYAFLTSYLIVFLTDVLFLSLR